MAPKTTRTGPARQRTRPSNDQVALTATATTTALSVGRGTGGSTPNLNQRRQLRVTSAPLVFASVFAPAGRRKLWWFTYVCGHCHGGHFGRADSEQAINGRRHRGSCGRLVFVRVARVYRGSQPAKAVGE